MIDHRSLTRREWLRHTGLSAVTLTMGNWSAGPAAIAHASEASVREPLLKRLIETGMENMIRWALDKMAKGDPETVVRKGIHPLPLTQGDVPHNIARAIHALLLGESVVGKTVPPEAEDVLCRYLYASLDNPTHLMARYVPKAGKRLTHAHNTREALLALTALIRFRDDGRARQYSHKLLERMLRLTRTDGTFNADEVARHPEFAEGWPSWGGRFIDQWKDAGRTRSVACNTRGRAITALCSYYRLTKEDQALELAERFARLVRRVSFIEEGKIVRNELGHTHSITGTVTGLIDYGLLTGNREIFEHGRRIFDVGLPAVRSSFGWSKENAWGEDGPPRPWRGEVNNTGDMIRAALLMGRSGLPQYFENVEQWIRSHVVQSQCSDQGWGLPAPSDREGGSGTKNKLDITAGVVHALCETVEALVTEDGESRSVNLPFSTWKGPVRIRSSLPQRWQLEVTPGASGSLRVRIPSWADRGHLLVKVDRQPREASVEDTWLVVADVPEGKTVSVELTLVEREVSERIRDRTYRVLWQGDTVVAMSPKGTVEPMYPSVAEYRADTGQSSLTDNPE